MITRTLQLWHCRVLDKPNRTLLEGRKCHVSHIQMWIWWRDLHILAVIFPPMGVFTAVKASVRFNSTWQPCVWFAVLLPDDSLYISKKQGIGSEKIVYFAIHCNIIIPVCHNILKTIITPYWGCEVCVLTSQSGSRFRHISRLRTCLDLPYHCDVNAQTVQPQHGVIIVLMFLEHTEIGLSSSLRDTLICIYVKAYLCLSMVIDSWIMG